MEVRWKGYRSHRVWIRKEQVHSVIVDRRVAGKKQERTTKRESSLNE